MFLRTIHHLNLKLRISSEHNASFKIGVSKVQDFRNFELSPMMKGYENILSLMLKDLVYLDYGN